MKSYLLRAPKAVEPQKPAPPEAKAIYKQDPPETKTPGSIHHSGGTARHAGRDDFHVVPNIPCVIHERPNAKPGRPDALGLPASGA
jgi:hypothetical protein